MLGTSGFLAELLAGLALGLLPEPPHGDESRVFGGGGGGGGGCICGGSSGG